MTKGFVSRGAIARKNIGLDRSNLVGISCRMRMLRRPPRTLYLIHRSPRPLEKHGYFQILRSMTPADFYFFFHSLPPKHQLNLGFIFLGLTLLLLLFLYCISRSQLGFHNIFGDFALTKHKHGSQHLWAK